MASSETHRGRDDNRKSDLAVMDANEYKQKFRLDKILRAVAEIEDDAKSAWADYVQGEIDYFGKNAAIQRAVKEAIRESYALLHDHQRQLEQDASGKDDRPRGKYWLGRGSEPIGVIRRDHSDNIVILGLRDFVLTREVYTERWEETIPRRNKPPKTVTHTQEYCVPEHVSWAAAFRLKEFLNDVHDLEVKFEELEDRRPYDDWREEFETNVYHGPDSVDLPHRRGDDDV